MTTAVQIRDAADAAILARIQDPIDRYTLVDGRTIQKTPLGDIFKARADFAAAAQSEEDGTSIGIFRWV